MDGRMRNTLVPTMVVLLHAVMCSTATLQGIDVIDLDKMTRPAAEAAGWLSEPFWPAQGLSTRQFADAFLGVAPDADELLSAPSDASANEPPLPDAFDWRTANTSLSSCIGPVVRQSPAVNGTVKHCGSCWAVSAVETLSDRHCVAMRKSITPTAPRVELSSLDLIACDKLCKSWLHKQCNHGCLGGYPTLAWEYFDKTGVVSSECMPYNLSKQLLCPLNACDKQPKAARKRYRTKRHYKPFGDGIRRDLIEGGPLQATFTVYEDFMSYRGGVYRHVSGRKLGLHAVEVIGFGVTPNGTRYWTAKNSWGLDFGINGTFMIASGECGFDEAMLAGDPCLPGDPYPCPRE